MTVDRGRPSIPETVTRSLPTLSAGERAAARALLADYPISGLETLSKFAQRAAVSAPTVLRFVVKLGFDGYPEFQRVIREEIQQRVTSPAARFPAAGHDPRNILGGFARITELIERTGAAADPSELEAVAGELARAPRLSALGGRVTSLLAHHLTHQLAQLRPGVALLPAGSTRLLERTVDLTPKDTIVVFDTRRYQDDTHRFARLATERGATIILLTDPLLSPISTLARRVLTFPVASLSPFETPIAGFALVEVLIGLATAALGADGERRVERIESLNAEWMTERTLLDPDTTT